MSWKKKLPKHQAGAVMNHSVEDQAAIDYYANWLSKRKPQLQKNIDGYSQFWESIPGETADEELKAQVARTSSVPTISKSALEKMAQEDPENETFKETLRMYDLSRGIYVHSPSLILYNTDDSS